MKGRKKTPTAILKLRGSRWAKGRDDDIHFGKSRPTMPRWLNLEQKRAWKNIVPILEKMGILHKADVTILTMYCSDFAEWRKTSEEVNKLSSLFIKQPSGRICKHPLIGIRDAAHERLKKICSELGMSPVARAGLSIKPEKQMDEIDELLAKSKNRFFKGG